ncbi:MAG: asparagine synthase (glutamine-hydrolyzing) [Polyangia bacterium]
MCGIVAVMAQGGTLDESACVGVERGMNALHHRGPDGQRAWLSPDRSVALGHTRLRIIDLAGGEQPIASEDETLHIVVNGELYDFERIQRELVAAGHRLRTGSDSEIALHLYEDLGPRCLDQLRGEFAFVLWDQRNDLLFAARDRFGVKPLYYAQHNGKLYLASELKALFEAGVPARWDEAAFYDHLHVPMTADRSLFHGVYQVPPGHYLVATRGHVSLVRYWDLDFPIEPLRLTEAECIEQTRAALTEAVRLRLRADVPVGCYLSGGVDSAAVIGLASTLRKDPIDAFTIQFADPSYDESAIAAQIARHVNARFHPVLVTEQLLADHFAAATRFGEVPAGNLHGTAKYILSKAVHQAGFKVVLTGDGSDEIFGGYAHFRRDHILASTATDSERGRRLADLAQVHQQTHGGLPLPNSSKGSSAVARAILGHLPTFLDGLSSAGALFLPLLRPELRERTRHRDSQMTFLSRFARAPLEGRTPVHQSMYLWSRSAFTTYLLSAISDRVEMGASIEARQPFLDHWLVELGAQLPMDVKIKGTIEKYVLREAVRPYLPAVVLDRVKTPFSAPGFGIGQGATFRAMLEDSLRSGILDAQPFFDPSAVRRALDQAGGPDAAGMSRTLTIVLGTAILHQHLVA